MLLLIVFSFLGVIMRQGTRVLLMEDYRDQQGFSFKAGQTGVCIYKLKGFAVIYFDGYEEEKHLNLERWKNHGTVDCNVPWTGFIPPDRLKAIPSK